MLKDPAQLIVKPHHPWRVRGILASLIIALPLTGWWMFDYGRGRAGFDSWDAAREQGKLRDVISRLEDEKETLQQQVAMLQRASEIDHEAYAEVDRSLKVLQDEILELKEEVAFYRGIIAPTEMTPGLRLQSLQLVGNGQERGYTYRLVLTQVIKESQITSGSAKISVEGMQDGAPKQVSFQELSKKDAGGIKFRFRYFQRVEGDLVLPPMFVPTRVRVELVAERPERATMEKVFSWAEVMS